MMSTQKSQSTNPDAEVTTPERVIDASKLNEDEETDTIVYWDENKGGRGLAAQVYQLVDGSYHQLALVKSHTEADNGVEMDADDREEGRTSLTAYNAVAPLPSAAPGRRGRRTARYASFYTISLKSCLEPQT
jgi:hypothetical protein